MVNIAQVALSVIESSKLQGVRGSYSNKNYPLLILREWESWQ